MLDSTKCVPGHIGGNDHRRPTEWASWGEMQWLARNCLYHQPPRDREGAAKAPMAITWWVRPTLMTAAFDSQHGSQKEHLSLKHTLTAITRHLDVRMSKEHGACWLFHGLPHTYDVAQGDHLCLPFLKYTYGNRKNASILHTHGKQYETMIASTKRQFHCLRQHRALRYCPKSIGADS